MKYAAMFGFAAGLSATSAGAATLDFTEIGATGIVPQVVTVLSNATITSFGDDTFVGGPGVYGEANNLGIICASPPGNSNCEEDMQIDFMDDIFDLTFASFAVAVGDSVTVTASLDGVDVGSETVTTETTIDFTSFGLIDSLLFEDNSTAAGIGFGDFNFSIAGAPPIVPLPASLPLALTGFLGFGLWIRRRNP